MSAVLELVARSNESKPAAQPVHIRPTVPLFEGWALRALAAMILESGGHQPRYTKGPR